MLDSWPSKSPNMTSYNFFIWGFIKDKVCEPSLPTISCEIKEISVCCKVNYQWHFTKYNSKLADVCKKVNARSETTTIKMKIKLVVL